MSAARRQRPTVSSTTSSEDGGLLGELHRDRLAEAPADPAPQPTPEEKPSSVDDRVTRMTLDLHARDRQRLEEWAARTGLDIGRPRLGSAAVLRAVVEAVTDPDRARPEVAQAVTEVLADREQRGLNTGP